MQKNKRNISVDAVKGKYSIFHSCTEVIPFSMSITNFTIHGLNMARVNVTLSSAGKVICVLGDSNANSTEIDYTEKSGNRFYFRTNVTTSQDFTVVPVFNDTQRLFCKGISLLPNVSGEDYFKSEPFYLTRTKSVNRLISR